MHHPNKNSGSTDEIITLDELYEYAVVGRKRGGMGEVLFLERRTYASPLNRFHLPQLAAKTFQLDDVGRTEELFERELSIWLKLSGLVPHTAELLRLCRIGGRLYAFMPVYAGSVRDLINNRGKFSEAQSIELISHCIACLVKAYKVHHLSRTAE